MTRPNILLITVDQMRGDCLGILGHPVVETPYLDTMARNGALFTNAFTAVPSCIPARASIMTGLSQRSHRRVGYQDGVAWNYEHTLAGEFAENGYHTQAVGKMHVHPLRYLCGFHNVVLHDGYLHYYRSSNKSYGENQKVADDYIHWLKDKAGASADIIDTGIECNSWVARPWIYPEQDHPTNWVVTQSIDFLRRRDPSKPFFLMSSFVRPHSPLDPPQVYYDMYMNKGIPDPPVGEWAEKEDIDQEGRVFNCTYGKVDPQALKRARAAYYGCITHIDHQIGRLLQALYDYDVLNNTIILFTSDHGDLLGDHNLYRKSLPYQGCISVPFIVYDPGNILGIQKGAVIDQVVELRDIMPSLLDFAGIEPPETVEGKSVLPLMKGEKVEWREYLHGEHCNGKKSNHFIVTENDKYIWYSQDGKEQYFKFKQDPHELCDLSQDPAYADRIAYLRQCLIRELEGREEGYTDGTRLIVGRPPRTLLSNS